MVTFYVINRLRHYREEQVIDDVPQWLKSTVEKMHDKEQFSESGAGEYGDVVSQITGIFDASISNDIWQKRQCRLLMKSVLILPKTTGNDQLFSDGYCV